MLNARNYLLIGNSRWHWALNKNDKYEYLHTKPNSQKIKLLNRNLYKWAAVGPIPSGINLNPKDRITIKDIPLMNLPSWIGIDRALSAWYARVKSLEDKSAQTGVLVADAGTILSLTRISANGSFLGGQLIAGLKLQLLAMTKGAENLEDPGLIKKIPEMFPSLTDEAMKRGSIQALTGAIIEAQRASKMPLWLCGGDSDILFKELKNYNLKLNYYPDLVMEAMIKL